MCNRSLLGAYKRIRMEFGKVIPVQAVEALRVARG
jgi:hypothetical protein